MGFTTDDSFVRVDFFRPSGKWYTTEAVKWTGSYEGDLQVAFAKSLLDHLTEEGKEMRLKGTTAICLTPYHQHSYPLMLEVNRVEMLVNGL